MNKEKTEELIKTIVDEQNHWIDLAKGFLPASFELLIELGFKIGCEDYEVYAIVDKYYVKFKKDDPITKEFDNRKEAISFLLAETNKRLKKSIQDGIDSLDKS